jgi:hypothetical protein
MIFSRRAILGVLALLKFALAEDASHALAESSYGGGGGNGGGAGAGAGGHRQLVQPRLEQLTLSPDFKITKKPTTRTYDWTISMKEGAPDGFYRQMLVVNGKPTVHAVRRSLLTPYTYS